MLQVEPENVYAEEGLGLTDGDEVDHLDDLLRADGQWLYYGVEEENFFLIQWYPDKASAEAKLAELEALGDGKQYLVDLSLTREKKKGNFPCSFHKRNGSACPLFWNSTTITPRCRKCVSLSSTVM